MDKVSKIRRSANMAAIKSVNTHPEIAVRKALFNAGLRYRLHDRNLPGRPDIVFRTQRIAIFVHGCFWHGCTKCIDGQRAVKSNRDYWVQKVRSNIERDQRNRIKLKDAGWHVEEIWECEIKDGLKVIDLINRICARKTAR